MAISDREEQDEKLRVMLQDADVRQQQQASTFHRFAEEETLPRGRFGATGAPRVIGSMPTPASQYPAASAAHQTELPPEEPLGYRVDEMPALESSMVAVEATDDPAVAPLSDDGPATGGSVSVSEPAGSSPSSETMAAPRKSMGMSAGPLATDVRAGRPPARSGRRSK